MTKEPHIGYSVAMEQRWWATRSVIFSRAAFDKCRCVRSLRHRLSFVVFSFHYLLFFFGFCIPICQHRLAGEKDRWWLLLCVQTNHLRDALRRVFACWILLNRNSNSSDIKNSSLPAASLSLDSYHHTSRNSWTAFQNQEIILPVKLLNHQPGECTVRVSKETTAWPNL